MANWPVYNLEVLGDRESLRRIVEILLPQTSNEYIEWNHGGYIYDSIDWYSLNMGGYTRYGVNKFKEIVDIITENKLTARFRESDQHNDTFISKYDAGELIYSKSKATHDLFGDDIEAWENYSEINKVWEMDWENMRTEYLNSLENSRSGKARVGTASDELPF